MKHSYRYIISVITILIFSTLACGFFPASQNQSSPENEISQISPLPTDAPFSPTVVDIVAQQDQFVSL